MSNSEWRSQQQAMIQKIIDLQVGTAVDRREDEECQRGTPGCSVDHKNDEICQTW